MADSDCHLLVGAGLAAAKAAQTLREEGFTGRVVLVGEERERPYERPPLSKDYLRGKAERSSFDVQEAAWYDEHSVELLLGSPAVRVDREGHELELANGDRLGYTKLLLATGATPRRLTVPGNDLDGVLSLRAVGDSDRLREAFAAGGQVVVIGGGWIGLETAVAARDQGCAVTVVEPNDAPLQAALGAELGGFFADLHRANGVDLLLGQGVTALLGDGRVRAVVTSEGTEVRADVVVAGVGAEPNTGLAAGAGLAVDNGILVDSALRTQDPDVFAAGDVARALHPFYGEHVRVEHWANALNQGPAAARSMLGQDVAYDRIPYFYTDQYDVGMEYSGWFKPGGYDRVVTRGDVEGKAFYAFWLAGDVVVAGMHVNLFDDGIEPVQELIRSRAHVDVSRLANPAVSLKELS